MRASERSALTSQQQRQVESLTHDRVGVPTKGTRMFAGENQLVVHTDDEGNKYLVVGGKDGSIYRIQLTRI